MPRIDPPPIHKGDKGDPGRGIIVSEVEPEGALLNDIWVSPYEDPTNLYSVSRFSLSFVFDGGENNVSPGVSTSITVPFDTTILGWRVIFPKEDGTAHVKIERSNFDSFPSVFPVSYGSFGIDGGRKAESSSLDSWNTEVNEGDILLATVVGSTTVSLIEVVLFAYRRQE